VVQIEDIMPYETFRQTEYYQFLQRHHFIDQIVMNLTYEDMFLGAIGIFHTEKEGAFTREQITVFETISRFVAQHYYLNSTKHSRRSHVLDMFRSECFQNLGLGLVVMDSTHAVLHANHMAERYAQNIQETLGKGLIHKGAQKGDHAFSAVQQMVNSLSHSLRSEDESFSLQVGEHIYQFYKSDTTSSSQNLNEIETLHIVLIDLVEGKPSSFTVRLPKALTARESEVATLIFRGYSNQQIANMMHISTNTVKTHILNIYKKLNVRNRTALIYKLHSFS